MTTKAPEALLEKIRTGHRFVITSHVNPDGDAVGSAVGLARILRKTGKGAVIWNRDETPKLYGELPGIRRIHVGEEPPGGFPDSFDGAIVLECPGLDRTGLQEALSQLPVLNIDHHLKNGHYGAVNWVDPSAPAVGEMVYRLAQGLRVELDAETATALFLTLVTDTGGFRFANATPDAFMAAADLVRDGARPEEVSRWLYESRPETALRLLGEMLQGLKLHSGGRVATAVLTRDMFERAGATESDTEGLVDYPRSIAGVEAVAVIRALEAGGCKVSLRSRGEVDVEKIAREHDGGGHRNAAGFRAEGDAEALRPQIVDLLTAAVG